MELSTMANKEENKRTPLFIRRKMERVKTRLNLEYIIDPIEKEAIDESEKQDLIKFTNNILVSCNLNYYVYVVKEIINYFKSLFLCNLFYFIIISNALCRLFISVDEPSPLWKRIIFLNLSDIIIILPYKIYNYLKNTSSINRIFAFLAEKICYEFNKDKNNKYNSYVEKEEYNILLYPKTEKEEDNYIPFMNSNYVLSKDIFFDRVIAYPNEDFLEFDYSNIEENEKLMMNEIFKFISDINQKVKNNNWISLYMTRLAYHYSCIKCSQYFIIEGLLYKIVHLLLLIFWDNPQIKNETNELINLRVKEFNEKNISNGYFLAVSESVVLLFRIKDNYKNDNETYDILYEKSQHILNKEFIRI